MKSKRINNGSYFVLCHGVPEKDCIMCMKSLASECKICHRKSLKKNIPLKLSAVRIAFS